MNTILQPKVSVIILNWNGYLDTRECLLSLQKMDYSNYEVILVDNNSSGDEAEVLRNEFGDYVNLIVNDQNYGFSVGSNKAIAYTMRNSKPDYLLLLNNDTIVAQDFLSKIVDAMETDPMIGLAGAKILYYEFPTYIQSVGCKMNFGRGLTIPIDNKRIEHEQLIQVQEVDYVDTCLLIRAKLVEMIGALDESFYLYWEDVDYAMRVKNAGYKVVSVADARIWHKKGTPFKSLYKLFVDGGKIHQSPIAIYYQSRNRFKFIKKWGSRWQYISFLFFYFSLYIWPSIIFYALFCEDRLALTEWFHGTRDGLRDEVL
jgi:hypothetical protein